jgi:glycosyltransferase involved in cell wall biosynthesis
MIAISQEVKVRIKTYYKRESKIIYPPVDVEKYSNKNTLLTAVDMDRKIIHKTSNHNLETESYYLIVSRLEPYKKVDIAIKAFNDLGYPLMIIGKGSEEARLRVMANKNIIFQGFVDDRDLPYFYQNAKGFIYPQIEDFGITAVEAQAAGVPVIALKRGGALDTIIENKTGVFFKNQNKKSLIEAIIKFEKMKFDKNILRNNAKKFSKEIFMKEILDLVRKTV